MVIAVSRHALSPLETMRQEGKPGSADTKQAGRLADLVSLTRLIQE